MKEFYRSHYDGEEFESKSECEEYELVLEAISAFCDDKEEFCSLIQCSCEDGTQETRLSFKGIEKIAKKYGIDLEFADHFFDSIQIRDIARWRNETEALCRFTKALDSYIQAAAKIEDFINDKR